MVRHSQLQVPPGGNLYLENPLYEFRFWCTNLPSIQETDPLIRHDRLKRNLDQNRFRLAVDLTLFATDLPLVCALAWVGLLETQNGRFGRFR